MPHDPRTAARQEADGVNTAAEGRYRQLAETLPDLISVHAPDGSFIYVSARARELLGYEPDDLRDTLAYDYVHPDDVERVTVSHTGVLGGQPTSAVYRLRRKDGDYRWVESTNGGRFGQTGEIVDIICVTRPVSDRGVIERITNLERAERARRIQHVIAAGRVTPVYQPIFDLKRGAMIGHEALARFPHPPEQPVDRWFEEAAEIGLTVPLELAAIRVELNALPILPSLTWLAVNASPQTLYSPQLAVLLERHAADRIVLEVTEHAAIADYDAFARAIAPLRDAGVRLAVDDVGTGFASLQHILRLAPDIIKLDRTLTSGLSTRPTARALAKAFVLFASEINTLVVAEGVETQQELRELISLGVTHAQGYYLARPKQRPVRMRPLPLPQTA